MVKVVRSHFALPSGPRVPRGLISVAVYSLIIAGALSISTIRLRAQSGAVDTPATGSASTADYKPYFSLSTNRTYSTADRSKSATSSSLPFFASNGT